MDILNISVDQFVANEENSIKLLECHDTWEKIPLINSNPVHNFKNETLVRFRGMIQDMHGPEYYVSRFHVRNEQTQERIVKNGKYRDVMQCRSGENIEFDTNNYSPDERHGYVVVSVPGINSWVSEHEAQKYKLNLDREEVLDVSTSQNKRSYDEAMEVDFTNEANTVKKSTSENSGTSNHNSGNSSKVSAEYLLNHPLSDSKAMVCHIRVYSDSDNLKLNDTFEFAGFLSLTSVERDDEDLEVQTHNPPTSLVPRIHVISFRKLDHCNPLVDNLLSVDFCNIKKELLVIFTQLLLGDTLAAEYLVCLLISEVYGRHEYMVLGQFALNISNVPKIENCDYVKEVYQFLELLVTKSHYLPFTLENMNTLDFIPKKDYESNRLNSGILQLSRNTLFLIDETKLEEGKLDAAGVRAVQSLAQAIKNQKVTYDFNYYPIDYECDLGFLIFSEGKSMLPSDVLLPLKPDEICLRTFGEIVDAAKHFLKPELLRQIRVYLTKARLIKYKLTDEVQELVSQEIVEMRRHRKVTAQDINNLLVLCRLICLSEGKATVDSECWRKACDMESKRKERMSS